MHNFWCSLTVAAVAVAVAKQFDISSDAVPSKDEDSWMLRLTNAVPVRRSGVPG